ncbi:hypothetical protein BSL78_21189 [Apostichopus japonicus]|uniref:Uncharacterized protein n=1 Tax=Stichopus japonicus TaxID=307972 RepID=A0A2G8K1T7_STIJA|nr:hypothetical protein BSL78_21189 [Apostichopus japonicus]
MLFLNPHYGSSEVKDPKTLERQCFETVSFRKIDSQSVHMCTMAILENAAKNEIPVPHLRLHRTYGKAKGGHIILQSGLQFSCPPSVQKIVLNSFGEYEELTDNEMIYLLVCVEHSHALVELQ